MRGMNSLAKQADSDRGPAAFDADLRLLIPSQQFAARFLVLTADLKFDTCFRLISAVLRVQFWFRPHSASFSHDC